MLNPSHLSWAACSCQAAPTPGHPLTEPPANRSCEPPDQTQLQCRWCPVPVQCGTDCGLRCCLAGECKWSEERKRGQKQDNTSKPQARITISDENVRNSWAGFLRNWINSNPLPLSQSGAQQRSQASFNTSEQPWYKTSHTHTHTAGWNCGFDVVQLHVDFFG